MNRRLGGVAVAIVLALLGTLGLVRYVQGARERAESGGRLVPVLVLSEAVPKGTSVDRLASSVRTARVPVRVRPADALTSLEQQEGKVAAVDLVVGEQLLTSRLVTPEVLQRAEVPKDKLKVTVSLDPERAVGGLIRTGDTVAVFASFEPFGARGEDGNVTPYSTHLILHKVPVVAVQQKQTRAAEGRRTETPPRGAQPAAPEDILLVTLAVDAPAAERVVFAAEHGTVWLSSEPTDANEAGTKIVTILNEYL